MSKASYSVVNESDEFVVIVDIGPWDQFSTVTNDAEAVVEELIGMLAGRKLFYYDSEYEFCELVIKDGKFAGFDPTTISMVTG